MFNRTYHSTEMITDVRFILQIDLVELVAADERNRSRNTIPEQHLHLKIQ